MNIKFKRKLLPLCTSLIMLPAQAGLYDALEEVYVTAQKTTQSTQDVGIAISAFTGDAIQDLGLANPMDLAVVTPGLSTANALSESIPIFSIRGVGLDDFNANNTGGVGVYVDEVFVTSPAMMSFQLFDLERVEVLKGPQGTIYGRNTTGGAINFISQKPTLENEAFINVDYSRFEKVDVTAAVSGPLSDNVNARLAIKYIDQGEGYKTDIATGDDIGKTEKWALRGLLDWTLADNVNLMLNLRAGADTGEPAPWHADDNFGYSALLGTVASPSDARKVDTGGVGFSQLEGGSDKPERDNDFWGTSATVTVDLDTMELVWISAYDDYSRDTQELYDGSPQALNDQWFQNEIDSFSQEVRLSSDASDDYSWLVGASYGVDNVESEDLSLVSGLIEVIYVIDLGGAFGPGPVTLGLPASVTSIYEQETTAYGLFGQTELYLDDQFTLTMGLRYTNEERSFDGKTIDDTTFGWLTGVPGSTLAALDDEQTEENISGKVALNWAPTDDLLIYTSVATGFKSGVYYGSPVADQAALHYVDPEELLAYEIGFKATLMDGKVRLNGSAFMYEYDDKQILVTLATAAGAAPTLANAPESEVDGAELELWASPIEGLTVQLTTSYINSKITKGLTNVGGTPIIGGGVSAGESLSLSPEWSYSSLLRYDWNIGSQLTAYVQSDYSWQDKTVSLVADPNGATETQRSLGARVAIGSADEAWEVAVWGRNLENEDSINYAYTNTLGDRSYSKQYPRTYGISATYNW